MRKSLLCVSSGVTDADPVACLSTLDWDVCTVTRLADAARRLDGGRYPVGLLVFDRTLQREPGLDAFLRRHRDTHWVGLFQPEHLADAACRDLITDYLSDYHTAPVDPARLANMLGHAHGLSALQRQREQVRDGARACPLVGDGLAMTRLRAQIERVAAVAAPVLIWGESGTGKELVAQTIHARSARSMRPFLPVNCGALAPNLIHAELFGYERGAFTGAARDKPGLIETADGGTLFLDEIGDLSLDLQASLLRFLQEKTVVRLGSVRALRVDVRVIAASHVSLPDAVAAGRFRADLFHRLAVLPITVPPLRERREDLLELARHFYCEFAHEGGRHLKGFSNEALAAIALYEWPGNVRELINRVRRGLVMADGHLIEAADIGFGDGAARQDDRQSATSPPGLTSLRECLERNGHNVSSAARELGVSRSTVYRLLGKHEAWR